MKKIIQQKTDQELENFSNNSIFFYELDELKKTHDFIFMSFAIKIKDSAHYLLLKQV